MNIYPSDFSPRHAMRTPSPCWMTAIGLLLLGMMLGYLIGLWQQAAQKTAAANTVEVAR